MAQQLLKINLLPESVRRPSQLPVEQLHRTPLAALVAVVMVALPILLQVPLQLHRRQLQQLNAKIQSLEPKEAEVKRVQGLLERLRAQQSSFQALKAGADSWAQRLNVLSSVTPNGVWFTDLLLDRTRGLVIQGLALASQGPEMVTATRLVQDLQAEPRFASAFKQIQLESLKRIQEGDFDLVQFTVSCTMAQSTTP